MMNAKKIDKLVTAVAKGKVKRTRLALIEASKRYMKVVKS